MVLRFTILIVIIILILKFIILIVIVILILKTLILVGNIKINHLGIYLGNILTQQLFAVLLSAALPNEEKVNITETSINVLSNAKASIVSNVKQVRRHVTKRKVIS